MDITEEDDLPDTGPVVEEQVTAFKSEDYWGKLIQLTNNGHNTRVLTEEVYRVGRAPSCELPISEADVDRANYTLISKVHFKIERSTFENSFVVYLEDLSSNGTFVNEKKVGKHKKIPLQSSAEISLASPNLKMYLYIDSSNNDNIVDWLHPNLASQFYVLKPLGAGTFGDVRLVVDQQNYGQFAMKKILKEKMSENRILNEVNILKRLKHPCIVNLEGIYDSPEAVFITLEYVAGGNLMYKITKMKTIPEPDCKIIFYQVLLGVEYLHNEGITHRDLKPENILINTNAQNDTIVKITDFGLSKIVTSQTHLKTFCGTLKYVAPEIIANINPTYNNKVDVWSLGVMLFVCLCGKYPFSSSNDRMELANEIVSGKLKISRSTWKFVSKQAVHIIGKMLTVDPVKRYSVNELLNHKWIDDDNLKRRISFIMNEKSIEDLEPVLKKQKLT